MCVGARFHVCLAIDNLLEIICPVNSEYSKDVRRIHDQDTSIFPQMIISTQLPDTLTCNQGIYTDPLATGLAWIL